MAPKPLLRRSPLRPDESLASLLVRLARDNGYPTLNFLLNLGQKLLAHPDSLVCPTRPETLTMLAELTGLDSSELFAATIHRWAETIISPGFRHFETITLPGGAEAAVLLEPARQQHFWPDEEAQFCPHCLAGQPYHRLSWLLQAAPVCLDHRCLLVQTCPECGGRLKIADVAQGQCSQCEFDLADSPTMSIAGDVWGQRSQHVIQSWFGREPVSTQKEGLLQQPPAVLYEVLSFLRRAIGAVERQWDYVHSPFGTDAAVSLFPCQIRSQLTPLRAYLVYATALTALQEWPHGFERFLDAYRLRDQRQPTDTALDDLGYLNNLRRDEFFEHPAYHFLQQAIGRYVQQNFLYSFAAHKLRRRQSSGPLPIPFDYISLAEAAKRLQLDRALVGRLVELGDLAEYEPPAGRPIRPVGLVRHQDVVAVGQRWSEGIPVADTARLLGLSAETVTALAEAEVIRPMPATLLSQEQRLDKRALVDLMERLRQGPVRYLYQQQQETVPLTAAAEPGAPLATLIQAILRGEVRAFWPPESPSLAHLRVVTEDVANVPDQER